jgi:hypothetical protein
MRMNCFCCLSATIGAILSGLCVPAASADVHESWAITGGTALLQVAGGEVTLELNQSTLEGISGNGVFRAFTAGSATFTDTVNRSGVRQLDPAGLGSPAEYHLVATPDTELRLEAPTGTYTLSAWNAVIDSPTGQFLVDEAQLVQTSADGSVAQIVGHVSLWLQGAVTNVQVYEPGDLPAGGENTDGPEICPNPTTGPDVIVGDLPNVSTYGSVNGIHAYAVGTTSCNMGNQTLNWIASTNQHPVIGQNLYRYKIVNGASRMEHIGQSWLKHGFTALAGNVCCPCTNPGTGSLLGVGCSDPYSSGLNGQQSLLGPRSHVNAATGCYPYPFTNPSQSACGGGNNYIVPPAAAATIGRRLQVVASELNPALNPGALYFVEGQYVAPDDTAAGNDNNNASYRRVNVGAAPSFVITVPVAFTTQRQKSAINAWQDTDPTVSITNVDIASDGRMTLGYTATNVCGNVWHYEYALYNMNSDRSAQSFSIPVPDDVAVANIEFRDVFYHSGEPYSGTDWTVERTNGILSWSTQTHATNVNANALRWGTTYNFRFDANAPPATADGTLGLFKPGTPTSVTVATKAPQSVPAVTQIVAANPPIKCLNPYKFNQPYRDALDTGTGAALTAGIGGAGTANQGPIGYSPILVTFGLAPTEAPTPDNVVVSCTDMAGNGAVDCPTVTQITSTTPGTYEITLSGPIAPRECTTIDFSAVAADEKVQYQSLPGDVNLDGIATTQDLLWLVLRMNDGAANLPVNWGRYNVNRSDETVDPVNTQDLLRLVQLLNGANTTQVFNGAAVAACP